ncbi:MAG: alpha-glucuronidase family glycosyl hydrolase [Limisphaerales bacterium]
MKAAIYRLRALIAIICLSLLATSSIHAKIAILVQPDALALEKFAAQELARYISALFGETPTITNAFQSSCDTLIVGNSTSNPLINPGDVPKLTDQGFVLKPLKNGAFLVGGGSPRATLWAVYELVERWGVRYLLHGDSIPAQRKFSMPPFSVVQEPSLRVRQWRVVNEHAMGPISWGIADYRPLIDQLAKLKFNRLLIYIWPGQPFLPLEFKGIKQTSGTLFFGNHFPIRDGMIGRSLFGDEKEFWNPDLPLPGNPQQLTDAAMKHIRALIAYAHERGLECVMPVNLTEFPREFKPVLAHLRPVDMTGTPTIGPGPDANVDDSTLSELAQTVLETTVTAYPDIDYIALDLPEWRAWTNQYERAWNELDNKYQLSAKITRERLLDATSHRKNYPGAPDRAVQEIKADIVALYFFDKILGQTKLTRQKLIVSSVAEELFPLLPKVLPAGCETLNFIDYTPSRVLSRREALRQIPARDIPSVLIYTLHDDNVGVLPQLATGSLHELTKEIRNDAWAGFSTRYWLIGDHDPCVAYLARAAWDINADPDKIARDQIGHVCGDVAVADMLTVFHEVEAATKTLEWNGLGLTFPTPQMIMQHWTPGELSAELKSVTTHYQSALGAANNAFRKSNNPYIAYWIGRLKFGIDYMHTIEAVRAAATAESVNNSSLALDEAKRALGLITAALTNYSSIARDRSDLGAIATINEFVYRPLLAGVAQLSAKIPPVQARDFQTRKVYQSQQHPSYTSWVSFFPGEHGQWYLGCEQVTTPVAPLPRPPKEWLYGMSLPRGYEQSKFLKQLVLLQSDDELKSWHVISRENVKESGGSFGQARTKDGRFLRFVWSCYSEDASDKPSEIFYESSDDGKTWNKKTPFVSDRFAWYPHRLRRLRDGTIILCAPRAFKWGKGTDYPVRAAIKLDNVSDMEMMLFFSPDEGRTWSNPLPILSGQAVSETDFVELPDGNLLFVNNSIFAHPGRQFVYRDGNRFTPGPLEHVHSGTVPETICLTDDGALVGCMRPGKYFWSADLGLNWRTLEGAPDNMDVYQPWIQFLGNGRVGCAGHHGADDPIGGRDQFVSLQTFDVQTLRKMHEAKLWIEREFDSGQNRFLNSFTISLKSNEVPLANREVEVWCVARDAAGYDSWNSLPLAERMKMGGRIIKLTTDNAGQAKLRLPEFDRITNIHASYQLVVRFNSDNHYADYNPTELPQVEFYANSGIDP